MWLDFNNKGKFSRLQFDTALRVLNLQGPLLKVRRTKLFSMMDVQRKGEVGIRQWREFFGYSLDMDDDESHFDSLDSLTGSKGARLLNKVKFAARFGSLALKRRNSCYIADYADSALGDEDRAAKLPALGSILEKLAAEDEMELSPSRKRTLAAFMPTEEQSAEASAICQDLKELDLSGIKALAYVLQAKCGSISKAFDWMDYNQQGSVARVQWETAAIVLNIDLEAVTGVTSADVFQQMQNKNGRIGKRAWNKFFSDLLSPEEFEAMQERRKGLKDRTKKVLKEKLMSPAVKPETPVKVEARAKTESTTAVPQPSIQRRTEKLTSRQSSVRRSKTKIAIQSRSTSGDSGEEGKEKTEIKDPVCVVTQESPPLPPSPPPAVAVPIVPKPQPQSPPKPERLPLVIEAPKPPPSPKPPELKKTTPRPKVPAPKPLNVPPEPPTVLPKPSVPTPEPSAPKAPTPTPPAPPAPPQHKAKRDATPEPPKATGVARVSPVVAFDMPPREVAVNVPIQKEPPKKPAPPTPPTRSERLAEAVVTLKERQPEVTTESDELRRRLCEDLECLEEGEFRELSIKRAERQVVEEVCRLLDLWINFEGDKLTVGKVGPDLLEIKRRIEAMQPGDYIIFDRTRPVDHLQYIKSVAEALGRQVADTGQGLEIVHMGSGDALEFKEAIYNMLRNLRSGEVVHFPSEINNNDKLEVVRSAALDLELRVQKLKHTSAHNTVLAVGRLDNWELEAYGDIERLRPGDIITFGTRDSSGTSRTEPWLRSAPQHGLPPICRQLLDQFGNELGCMVSESKECDVTIVTIIRPADEHVFVSEDEGDVIKITDVEDANLQERVGMVFQQYASGKQGRTCLLLRKPDLTIFVEEVLHIKRIRSLTEEARLNIEDVYEEILELQVDMGSSYYHGITMEYFQVFLSEVVNILGWSLGATVKQLLEWQACW